MLTATQRLARATTLAHDRLQAESGVRAWPAADVLPLEPWLERCWDEVLDRALPLFDGGRPPRLLSALRERLIWEQIVQNSDHGPELLDPGAVARTAQEAWTLLRQWRLTHRELPGPLGRDVRAFCAWAETFDRMCADEGWLDRGRLPAYLSGRLSDDTVTVPRHLLWAGFDHFPPNIEGLLSAMGAAGAEVEQAPEPSFRARVRRVAPEERAEEVERVALWARYVLEQDPHARVGIVAPDLEPVRQPLRHALSDVLQPGRLVDEEESPLFNVSLGPPLARYPVVHAALNLLRLDPRRCSLRLWGFVLRCPFVGGFVREASRRGGLEAKLRREGEPDLDTDLVVRRASTSVPCPDLAERLRRWLGARTRLEGTRTARRWVEHFAGLLDELGWPGDRTLTSREYQAVAQWHQTLRRLAGLSDLLGPMAFDQALSRLRELAFDSPFQPQSTVDAPVQVLGLLEAGGLAFDHLWLLDMREDTWPRPSRPNPLLPVPVQRELGMPRAGAARELDFARRVTRRLLRAAPDVVVSHPRREGDRALRPSPLVADVPRVPRVDDIPASSVRRVWQVLCGSTSLDRVDDRRGPRLPEGNVKGGTGLFRAQAACPFSAFARYRLAARQLDAVGPLLTLSERGVLVHAALERIWKRLASQRALHEADDATLTRLTHEAAQQAVQQMAQQRPALFGPQFGKLEQRRLTRLMEAWLTTDSRRPPFDEVKVEQPQQIAVGGLVVEGQPDRMDRLPDGSWLVIDYKVGSNVTPRSWEDERPDEPQLPLYALSDQVEVSGVAFARVRPPQKNMTLTGISGSDSLGKALKPPPGEGTPKERWQAQVRRWRTDLEQLAHEYRAGWAEVAPKDPVKTCRLCDLAPLCRVNQPSGEPKDADRNKIPDNEGVEAPRRQGAKRANTGRIQPMSNAAGADGSAPERGGYFDQHPKRETSRNLVGGVAPPGGQSTGGYPHSRRSAAQHRKRRCCPCHWNDPGLASGSAPWASPGAAETLCGQPGQPFDGATLPAQTVDGVLWHGQNNRPEPGHQVLPRPHLRSIGS